jgi:hypothetical protein
MGLYSLSLLDQNGIVLSLYWTKLLTYVLTFSHLDLKPIGDEVCSFHWTKLLDIHGALAPLLLMHVGFNSARFILHQTLDMQVHVSSCVIFLAF